MFIKVINPGLVTTVQDLGRPGYYHLGIPIGGAMDRFALRVANLLIGNDEGAAGLETVFMGPELQFSEDTLIAVTGAELPPLLDQQPCSTWSTIKVKAGQTLSFDYLRSGARAYIAVAGGINTPKSLGSCSTYAIGALGGIGGRAIQAGDSIPLGQSKVDLENFAIKSLANEYRNLHLADVNDIRMLPGLYWHRISDSAKKNFFADTWKVAPEADRMGYRFQGGRPLEFIDRKPPFGAGSDPSNITDACYPYGSIQVPSGTEPIILHRDAVSGGGYFMIGTVISADMDLIGQLQPNVSVKFVEVDMDTALEARKKQAQQLEQVREVILK